MTEMTRALSRTTTMMTNLLLIVDVMGFVTLIAPGGDGPPMMRRAPIPYRTDSRENLDICQFERETRAYHPL